MQLGEIAWLDGVTDNAPACPVCADGAPKRQVLETASAFNGNRTLRLVRCGTCGTQYWNELAGFHYEDPSEHSWATSFYVEQGASVDGLIEPIARLPTGVIENCLEIGCGFGFSLDAANILYGWKTVGVDPSPLARAGRAALGIDIRSIYANADTELGGPFDVVYGSEVIEHIANPHGFLSICRAHLAPGGILVLTTPDGDSIRRDTPTSVLMPLISPGHHLILFNRLSLKTLAHAAGFEWAIIVPREYGLVLYASDRPFDMDDTTGLDRSLYRSYLIAALDRPESPADLQMGLRYRLMKELANAGDHNAALALYDSIAEDCQTRFGFTLSPLSAATLVPTIRQGARNGAFGAPFCLPGLFFYRGIIALNASPAPGEAALWFDAAALTAQSFRAAYQEIGIDDGETGTMERSAPEYALLALCHNDPALAVSRLRLIAQPSEAIIQSLTLRLLDLGQFNDAAAAASLAAGGALPALVGGWLHLVNGRDAEAHAAFLECSPAEGRAGLKARSGDMIARASFDPDAAVAIGRALGAEDPASLDSLFTRLVDYGHLEQALVIEPLIEHRETWQIVGRRAMLALLNKKEPGAAAGLFAQAFGLADESAAELDLWRLKYHELLAWITAADALAGQRAASEIQAAGEAVPEEIRISVDALLEDHPSVRPAELVE